jgi:hypothetical protein
MHRVRRRVATAAAVIAVGALAACTAQTPAPQPTGLPAGMEVSFVQLRSDVASRQAEVRIRNGGDAQLIVGSVSVTDPRFDGAADRIVARTSTIPPGAATDIRVQLPPVACPAPDDAVATVSIGYTLDGVDAVAVAPLPDPLAFVPPLHERECRAAALAEVADVSFTAFTPSNAGKPSDLELTVAPTGDGAAQLTGIRETNLLTFDMPGGAGGLWPLEVAVRPGDAAPVVVHLPLVPARCDPHAVLEDKRGTVFWVEAVTGGEPSRIDLAAGDEMRGRILTWVAHWCGYGP